MADFWESKHIKKSRKKHHCEFCFVIIPIGSSCWNEVGKFIGDFNNYYLCERCKSLIDSGYPWHDSGDWLGEFIEALQYTDALKCPECQYVYSATIIEVAKDKMSLSAICDNCDARYIVDLSVENLLKVEVIDV